MDSFMDPSGQSLYTPKSISNIVYQPMRRKETNNKGDSAIDTPVNRLDTHEFFQEALPPPKKKAVPWNKGRTGIYSEETRYKMGSGRRGKPSSKRIEFTSPYELYYLSVVCKYSADRLADTYGVERTTVYNRLKEWGIPRINRTKFINGHKSWHKGKTGIYSKETLKMMSESHIGKSVGAKNPRWKGGCEPYYGPTWYSQKRQARQRDHGICYMCSANEKDHSRRFDIHHIEPYRISQDNSLVNLMTLCPSCHGKIESITEDN